MEPRNQFQGINSASLCSLAGRYANPIPIRFLAPIDCLKVPALSSYWLAHFYLMKNPAKCCSILVWIARCWNYLLTSQNPKNNWCLSHIFGAQFSGKDRGLSTCKPRSKQAGGWIHSCMKQLRTLNYYQIFKFKIKKSKTYGDWCPFQGPSNGTTLIQIKSGRT